MPDGRRVGGLGEKVKGLSANWQLQNTHEDVKYSIGNIVSHIVITAYHVRLVIDFVSCTSF